MMPCGKRSSWIAGMTRAVAARRRAMTLVELLVVVAIMLMLAAVAIPAMRPSMEGRKTREAARAINVYLSSARNRAIESGRPVGVQIERDIASNLSLAGVTLYQVEVPLPYSARRPRPACSCGTIRRGGDRRRAEDRHRLRRHG